MDNDLKNFLISTAVVIATITILVSCAVGVRYWQSTIQKEVWHRQGVEMTTFEIFIGCAPIERSLVNPQSVPADKR